MVEIIKPPDFRGATYLTYRPPPVSRIVCECDLEFSNREDWEKHSREAHPVKWRSASYSIGSSGGAMAR